MEIHLSRLIPGVFSMAAGLLGFRLVVEFIRGEYAIADEIRPLASLYRPSADWMTSERLQREFDAWSRNGYYPPRIEGRCETDGERFRPEWSPLPANTRFMTWWGMTRRDYERNGRAYTASGFSLESSTQYTDCRGVEKVQATWLRR